jgi:excisionase family DNA binding protein
MSDIQKLYTEKQVAKMLGVTVQTFKLWRKAGKVGFIQTAGTIRISQTQLDEFLKKNTVDAK